MDIASNVSGAQRELLKYYASISSNRWLMLKVFGVLIVFVSLHYDRARLTNNLLCSVKVPYFYPRVIICSAAGCVCKYFYRTLFYEYATRYTKNEIVMKRSKWYRAVGSTDRDGVYTSSPLFPFSCLLACLRMLPPTAMCLSVLFIAYSPCPLSCGGLVAAGCG